MKIAILTQPLHNNYGGILQNFALQRVLKELGHDSTTVDIAYPRPTWPLHVRFVKILWRFIKRLFGDKSVLFCDIQRQWLFMNQPGTEQQRFIKDNLTVAHFERPLDSSFCQQNHFDAYVVGSDQVWRPRFSPFLPNFFLDFTQGQRVKRLSYAASFGTDHWEGTAVETIDYIPLMRQFDAISVREESGVKVCRNVFGVQAVSVLDPTLLVEKNMYDSLLSTQTANPAPYLAVYVLDHSPAIIQLIQCICTHKNLKPIFLGQRSKNGYPSIESWIHGIFNSAYVLTDSFHGTVFSIIAHRPFTAYINSGRGASRFESLLGKLNLMDRLTSNEHCTAIDCPIDYAAVDRKLGALRKQSILFLKQNLDGEYDT